MVNEKGMSDIDEENEKLQKIVDKTKTLALLNSTQNITPPSVEGDTGISNIELIKALDNYPKIQEIYLEAQGLIWDEKKKELVRFSQPYLNKAGARKLVSILKKFAVLDWGNIPEEQIPYYLNHYFKENYPYFTFWQEEYGLDPKDFNYVATTLQTFLVSSLGRSKGGKLLNLLGRTYSEDSLIKIMGRDGESNKKKEGFLDKYNPFKRE